MDLQQALAEVADEQYRAKFAVGDIVVLKSGGVDMVVSEVTDFCVVCVWHTKDGFLQQTTFKHACLVIGKKV